MNAKPKANPLQSIAQLVQKEFQEQSAERFIANTNILNNNSRKNKMGFSNTEIEIPDFPKTSSMESTRSIRKNETVNFNDSDDPSDWKDSKGNKVKNWKQKMQSVWFKDENKIIIVDSKPEPIPHWNRDIGVDGFTIKTENNDN